MKIQSNIFNNCSENEINMILSHLCLPIKTYEKGEYIYRVGDSVRNIGIVVSGSVCIENVDIVGNKSVLAVAQSGEIFAEAYACVENQPILVDVVAAERCEILFLCVERLFDGKINCTCKDKIIKNLVMISSSKNIRLSRRIFHTSSKTVRGRVMSYLSQQAAVQGSKSITVPFNRQQMADYLSLDRSALSKELGKMKRDGIIDYYKNSFKLLK